MQGSLGMARCLQGTRTTSLPAQPFAASPLVQQVRRAERARCSAAGPAQQPSAQQKAASKWTPPTGILKISPELVAEGGLPPSRDGPQAQESFSAHLSSLFLQVNLSFPNLRILNIDPPIISVPNFLTPEECDALVQAAGNSGLMKQSGIGGNYAQATGGKAQAQDIRTSSTLAATAEVLKSNPALQAAWEPLLSRARHLLPGCAALPSDPKALFAKPTAPGQVALELPQVARYTPGQHFLTHEDAFPLDAVASKGYQRRATLLVYLNDVSEGGATHFDILGLSVRPMRGSALLFFPSFINSVPDHRTLHTAQDAVDEKWVMQLWLSVGVQRHTAAMPAFVRGTRNAPPNPPGRKRRGVPAQQVNTKI